ncbi:MAG: hypothetical protein ACREJP_05445 [Candidatus Methylomirabilales bacterium]
MKRTVVALALIFTGACSSGSEPAEKVSTPTSTSVPAAPKDCGPMVAATKALANQKLEITEGMRIEEYTAALASQVEQTESMIEMAKDCR